MSELTEGSYETEPDAEAALDEILARIAAFKVYKQVDGRIMQPRFGTDQLGVRIDRLLVPNEKIVGLGWNHGCIGIECKRSGKKIGRPLSQMMDYSRTVWEIPPTNFLVVCRYIFLWPGPTTYNTTASIMEQNNLGSACLLGEGRAWERFSLRFGQQNLLTYLFTTNEFTIVEKRSGNKTGSR